MALVAVKVSVVLVTRGDVDLAPIIGQDWPDEVQEIVVWNNAEEQRDLKVYGRYAAIWRTHHPVILTQDDDCLIPAADILAAYESGRLVANMPRSRWEGYPDSALLGWGSVFDRELPMMAFGRYALGCGVDSIADILEPDHVDWIHVTCDVMFSSLTPRSIVDFPFVHLPWAEGPGRMFTSRPAHNEERQRMLDVCRMIRGEDDDRRDW